MKPLCALLALFVVLVIAAPAQTPPAAQAPTVDSTEKLTADELLEVLEAENRILRVKPEYDASLKALQDAMAKAEKAHPGYMLDRDLRTLRKKPEPPKPPAAKPSVK